jgi:hypothetical protein
MRADDDDEDDQDDEDWDEDEEDNRYDSGAVNADDGWAVRWRRQQQSGPTTGTSDFALEA